jgi:hypothetical protein
MNTIPHYFIKFFSVVILIVLAGCASTYEKREVNSKPVQLSQATSGIAENQLLGVRIRTFDPGKIPASEKKARGISKEIRAAEGYFIAVRLKETMQRSGHWGPVRVVPADSLNGEVMVSGVILRSDGELLDLLVNVGDATGNQWFSKEYSGVVDEEAYKSARTTNTDAFQFLYNQISNDIALHKGMLKSKFITSIRQVAELKFASEFAPEIFDGFLKKNDRKFNKDDVLSRLFKLSMTDEKDGQSSSPTYTVSRLPAQSDPNFRRIKRIRSREHLLIDTLDQQYDALTANITPAYTQWRMARLSEMNSVRNVEELEGEKTGQAIAAGLLGVALIAAGANNNNSAGLSAVGGVVLSEALKIGVEAAKTAKADRKIHERALEELGESLASEVQPIVVEVEGEAIELKGTVEAKFQQWRRVMRKLHEQEVGPLDK